MATQRRWRLGFLVLVISCLVPPLSAVIIEVRQYHGRQVTCAYSGLMGVAKACGTEGYERVFTGIVRSSVEKGDTDKLVEIAPDEVFLGDSSDAAAVTNQACLNTEIQAGDRWLFYLSRDSKGEGLVLSYASPSKPASEAEHDISLLRDLGHLENSGLLIGHIERLGGNEDEFEPLANHKVIAKNIKDGTKYSVYTDEKGRFNFELPVGRYDVATAPEYGLHEVENVLSMQGSVPVESHKCWEHDFAVKEGPAEQKAIISGHVGSPDGKPFTVHPWVQIVSMDGDTYTSAYVDAKGYFEAKDVRPGRYIVGLGIEGGTDYFNRVPTPVYYPGVRTKQQAIVIEIRAGEKRTNVDFQLPPEDVLKPLKPSTSNH